jgi:hypothetical protein
MKKLRMIVSSVIVLAIVGSAFAFSAKKVGVFCKSTTNQPNTNCAIVTGLQVVSPGTPNTFYYQLWNQDPAKCVPNNCPDAVQLDID